MGLFKRKQKYEDANGNEYKVTPMHNIELIVDTENDNVTLVALGENGRCIQGNMDGEQVEILVSILDKLRGDDTNDSFYA